MNQLPDELISEIMEMINLKDVCRCMRVNRRWEVMARGVIRLRQSLLLCSNETAKLEWVRSLQTEKSPTAVSCFLTLDVLMGPFHHSFSNCVSQMTKLGSLIAHGACTPSIQPIIVRNAATLYLVCTFLWAFPEDVGVQYPNLKWLTCVNVTPEVIALCPRLEMLRMHSQVQQNVPQSVVDKATITDLSFFSDPETPATGIREMLEGVKMLTNLKVMRLLFRDPYKWIDRNKAWDSLFNNYHNLTEVMIFGNEKAIIFDEAVQDLVLGNPHLKIFDLRAFWVTDASLVHLAKLHHLLRLILTQSSNSVTADGVLTLLRGSSRKVIRYVQIHRNEYMFPADPFHAELMLIAQVTGKLLELESGYRMIKIGS
jgi:hypothetical protein